VFFYPLWHTFAHLAISGTAMDTDYTLLLDHFANLAIALALGLLVGSERGWHGRSQSDGSRVAGIRTFSLIALLGGLMAAIGSGGPALQSWLLCALAFIPLALLLIASYVTRTRQGNYFSITTEVAAMATYWLGVLPGFDLALPAAASAVIVALLLHLKDRLHGWLLILDARELLGTLQFLLVSVVFLPLLPNQGFGPWQALNPFQIWWMVVLISGLSLAGYFATRIAGSRKGILATSLAGGLASSTAVTLSLSRLHSEVKNTPVVAAGILLACGTMFVRILVVAAVINASILPSLALPMAVGALTLLGCAWSLWRSARGETPDTPPAIHNPFQLVTALQFGGLLALVMLAADALQHWFGSTGLYALSVFTGIADVDTIVLSLSPRAGDSLLMSLVVVCIALAAATNTLMKGVYSRLAGGPQLGWTVLRPTALAALLVVASAGLSLWLGHG